MALILLVSLKTITDSSLKININTLNALASLAIFTTSRKTMANPIIVDVVKIAGTGVKILSLFFQDNYDQFIFWHSKGNPEDANTPRVTIDINVITPTTPA